MYYRKRAIFVRFCNLHMSIEVVVVFLYEDALPTVNTESQDTYLLALVAK